MIDWNRGFRTALAPIAGDRVDALMSTYHAIERRMEAEAPHRHYRDVLTAGLTQAAATLGLPLAAAEVAG